LEYGVMRSASATASMDLAFDWPWSAADTIFDW
jgi:hypothetical protein